MGVWMICQSVLLCHSEFSYPFDMGFQAKGPNLCVHSFQDVLKIAFLRGKPRMENLTFLSSFRK